MSSAQPDLTARSLAENSTPTLLRGLRRLVQMLCDVQHRGHMLISKHLIFTLSPCKQLSRLEHILNLATIHAELGQLVELRGVDVVLAWHLG